ncbi:hypothetical protein Bealeia1_01592 [Candidatus Bealeia paramacronuclearis]|uniref:DUF349 domain-containing protein n=1 Tax=Candidatus Bealeia paramacronuclearis TaxID=1921001 RepID=A0ABZ2C4S2_9PROT|nr:hypothetical protein [Candidatus Bealeia paramacronuclearis]
MQLSDLISFQEGEEPSSPLLKTDTFPSFEEKEAEKRPKTPQIESFDFSSLEKIKDVLEQTLKNGRLRLKTYANDVLLKELKDHVTRHQNDIIQTIEKTKKIAENKLKTLKSKKLDEILQGIENQIENTKNGIIFCLNSLATTIRKEIDNYPEAIKSLMSTYELFKPEFTSETKFLSEKRELNKQINLIKLDIENLSLKYEHAKCLFIEKKEEITTNITYKIREISEKIHSLLTPFIASKDEISDFIGLSLKEKKEHWAEITPSIFKNLSQYSGLKPEEIEIRFKPISDLVFSLSKERSDLLTEENSAFIELENNEETFFNLIDNQIETKAAEGKNLLNQLTCLEEKIKRNQENIIEADRLDEEMNHKLNDLEKLNNKRIANLKRIKSLFNAHELLPSFFQNDQFILSLLSGSDHERFKTDIKTLFEKSREWELKSEECKEWRKSIESVNERILTVDIELADAQNKLSLSNEHYQKIKNNLKTKKENERGFIKKLETILSNISDTVSLKHDENFTLAINEAVQSLEDVLPSLKADLVTLENVYNQDREDNKKLQQKLPLSSQRRVDPIEILSY